jgi:hypothetical protein
MRVSDEKWHEIVNEVKAGIARWNAKASEHKTGDTFHPVLKENGLMGGFTTLSTFHDHAAKMIAREPATGEVRKIKFIWREGRIAVPRSIQKIQNHGPPHSQKNPPVRSSSNSSYSTSSCPFLLATSERKQPNKKHREPAVGRTARSPSGIRLWQCPNRV